MPTRSKRNCAGIGAQRLDADPRARGAQYRPAIALAALAAGEDAALLVMPSDHVIADIAAFHAAVQAALPMVEQGWLVTFGIDPHAPETGYGWIHVGEGIAPRVHRVASFVEKPPRDRAEACWRRAIMCGTAASSCSAPTPSSARWRSMRPTCSTPRNRRC